MCLLAKAILVSGPKFFASYLHTKSGDILLRTKSDVEGFSTPPPLFMQPSSLFATMICQYRVCELSSLMNVMKLPWRRSLNRPMLEDWSLSVSSKPE